MIYSFLCNNLIWNPGKCKLKLIGKFEFALTYVLGRYSLPSKTIIFPLIIHLSTTVLTNASWKSGMLFFN